MQEATGIITIIEEETAFEFNGKLVPQQIFTIKTIGEYPKIIAFQLFDKTIQSIQGFSEGDEVNVKFNLESKKSKDRWYTNAKAFAVEKIYR